MIHKNQIYWYKIKPNLPEGRDGKLRISEDGWAAFKKVVRLFYFGAMDLLVNQLRANSTKVGPEPVFVSPWAIWSLPNKGTMSDMEKRLTYWVVWHNAQKSIFWMMLRGAMLFGELFLKTKHPKISNMVGHLFFGLRSQQLAAVWQ